MISEEDATKLIIFEQQRKELERTINSEFNRSSYPKQVEIYANMKKCFDNLQVYAKEISQRSPPALDLMIELKELLRKTEALKTKMKKHID